MWASAATSARAARVSSSCRASSARFNASPCAAFLALTALSSSSSWCCCSISSFCSASLPVISTSSCATRCCSSSTRRRSAASSVSPCSRSAPVRAALSSSSRRRPSSRRMDSSRTAMCSCRPCSSCAPRRSCCARLWSAALRSRSAAESFSWRLSTLARSFWASAIAFLHSSSLFSTRLHFSSAASLKCSFLRCCASRSCSFSCSCRRFASRSPSTSAVRRCASRLSAARSSTRFCNSSSFLSLAATCCCKSLFSRVFCLSSSRTWSSCEANLRSCWRCRASAEASPVAWAACGLWLRSGRTFSFFR
mmetsp:Transcript_116410/g.324384  ORF Transcript_116410/g.324384 Transcript_116410/m.324384 type:complete len:308 (+) Transcript_116410:2226-3149(+)